MQVTTFKGFVLKEGNFTLASGKQSNYYIDIKGALLNPVFMTSMSRMCVRVILQHPVDAIASIELGSVPLMGCLVKEMSLPGLVVRKKKKEHGTEKRIEGNIKGIRDVVLLEDVVTTGNSTLNAVYALLANGLTVRKVITIFDRLDNDLKSKLNTAGIDYHPLYTSKDLGL